MGNSGLEKLAVCFVAFATVTVALGSASRADHATLGPGTGQTSSALQGRHEKVPGFSASMDTAETTGAINEGRTAVFAQSRPVAVDRSQELLIKVTDPEPPELHRATRRVLAKLHQPVVMKLYYAHAVAATAPEVLYSFEEYHQSLHRLLQEYVTASRGMIQLQVIDPEPYSEDEEAAIMYGLKKFAVAPDNNFYLGLVLETQHGVTKVIPFLAPDRRHLIEYDITSLIDRAITPERRRLGILSSLLVMGEDVSGYMAQMMRMQGQQPKAAWTFVEQLRKQFEVTHVPTDVDDIDGVDILLVVHPKNLPEKTQFAIDQFVLKGGRTIVCVDPHCSMDRPQGKPMQMTQRAQSSELNRLMRPWGLEMPSNTFAGDRSLAMAAAIGRDRKPEPIIGYLNLTPTCFNEDSVITTGLNQVRVLFAGILREVDVKGPDATQQKDPDEPDPQEAAPIKRTPLVMTTAQGNGWSVATSFELMFIDPAKLMAKFVRGTEPVQMGYLVTGRFKSSFPEGIEIKVEAEGDDPNEPGIIRKQLKGLTEAGEDCAVVVFSDVDFLSDQMAYTNSFFGKVVVGDNAALLINAVTCLLGSDELIDMLGSAIKHEPRSLIAEISHRVEGEYARELSTSEALVIAQARVKEFEQELQSLVSTAKEDANDGVSGSTLLAKKAELEKKILQAAIPLRRLKRERYESRRHIRQLASDLRGLAIPGWLADEVDLTDLESLVLRVETDRVRLRRRGGGTIVVVKDTSAQQRHRPPVSAPAFAPAPLIQGLDVSQVARVQIETPAESIALERRPEGFGIVNKHNYPARMRAVNELISSCLDTIAVDYMTDDTDSYQQFGLTAKTAESAVRFLKANDALLAGMVVGDRDQQRQGHYVRLLPGSRVYLARKVPSLECDVWRYADPDLLSLVADDIESVTVISDQGEYTMRAQQDESHDEKDANGLERSRFLRALCALRCDDMDDAAGMTGLSFDCAYICRMSDTTEYRLKLAQQDGRWYVQCEAEAHTAPVTMKPDEVASEAELKEKEARLQVQENAQRFTQRHKDWVYRIPQEAARDLTAPLRQ